MKMQKPLFFHGKTTDNIRFTVAGLFDDNNLNLGVAICSKKNAFVKKVGRAKAEGRAFGLYGLHAYPKGSNLLKFKGHTELTAKTFFEHVSQYNTITSNDLKNRFALSNK
jgi:hypothetical protein